MVRNSTEAGGAGGTRRRYEGRGAALSLATRLCGQWGSVCPCSTCGGQPREWHDLSALHTGWPGCRLERSRSKEPHSKAMPIVQERKDGGQPKCQKSFPLKNIFLPPLIFLSSHLLSIYSRISKGVICVPGRQTGVAMPLTPLPLFFIAH